MKAYLILLRADSMCQGVESSGIKAQDFRDCGWEKVLAEAEHDDYQSIGVALYRAAKAESDPEHATRVRVLNLLARICGLRLTPESFSEPFRRLMAKDGQPRDIRGVVSESEVGLLSQVVGEVDHPRIRARMADIVWVSRTPACVDFALMAIDAYRSVPLTKESWGRDTRACWERALMLGAKLGASARPRLHEMVRAIFDAFMSTERAEGFFALALAEFLRKRSLGAEHAMDFQRRLEEFASAFEAEGELYRAGKYYREARDWCQLTDDEAECVRLTVALAESTVSEGDARVASEPLAALTFYEQAIQIYRSIPRKMREPYDVAGRLRQLERVLRDAGERSIEEMSEVSVGDVDITECIAAAREAVKGKTSILALLALAKIHARPSVQVLRDRATERLRDGGLAVLFASTGLSSDGRLTSFRPGMGVNQQPEENQALVHDFILQEFFCGVGIAVSGGILPALDTLHLEHHLRLGNFVDMACASPYVPLGREGLWGKALYAGYDGDFISAAHILAPQIEHFVRSQLRRVDVKTSVLSSEGIEREIGLTNLMECSEVTGVLGENLAFEIRAIFCDPRGPNLRNNLAHGLFNTNQCLSEYSVYAWWLAFQLVFSGYWSTLQQHDPPSDGVLED